MQPIRHFRTITRHRHIVIRYCFRAGIGWQGLRHDLSKYSPTEFWNSAKNYQGNRSPNDRERELYGFSKSWMHHKGRNRHHFEYWTDYSRKTHRIEPVKMPLRYVMEMFCDRIAACRVYQGDRYTDQKPLDYFQFSKGKKLMQEDTEGLLETMLTMLAQEGEEKTFACIRRFWKRHKHDGDAPYTKDTDLEHD